MVFSVYWCNSKQIQTQVAVIRVQADWEHLDACFLFNWSEAKLLISWWSSSDALLRFITLLSETFDISSDLQWRRVSCDYYICYFDKNLLAFINKLEWQIESLYTILTKVWVNWPSGFKKCKMWHCDQRSKDADKKTLKWWKNIESKSRHFRDTCKEMNKREWKIWRK